MLAFAEFVSASRFVKIHRGHLHALAATARLANLPSVISNVMLGTLLVGAGYDAGLVLVAAVCLYLSGGFLNDWADRTWDAAHRAERALPQGLFTPVLYLWAGLLMAGCGLLAAAYVGWFALLIAVAIASCILIYTWLHKKSPWSAFFMGMCRALLPLLGWAVAPDPSMLPVVLLAGLALLCHVAGISLLARRESLPMATKRINHGYSSFAGSALVMLFCAWWYLELPPAAVIIGLLPYLLWTSVCLLRRMSTAARVAGLLAGIPLVDSMLLLPIHLSIDTGSPHDGFIGPYLWLPPLAFVAGKLLQRYAPAT